MVGSIVIVEWIVMHARGVVVVVGGRTNDRGDFLNVCGCGMDKVQNDIGSIGFIPRVVHGIAEDPP